jgi:DNA-binding GntR family transcriptional regulator
MAQPPMDFERERPLSLLTSLSDDTPKREQAYHQLRRLLVLQQIPEGTRLRESEWTKKLGVNRSALREALARLEAEALAQACRKTGYVVPRFTIDDIKDVLTVRMMLERGAIETVCASGLNTLRHLKPMRQACVHMERLIQDEYLLGAIEADWRFHEALVLAAGNRRLIITYRHSRIMVIHRETIVKEWEANLKRAVADHWALFNAIIAGDSAKAIEILRAHLLAPAKTIRAQAKAI